MSYKTVGLENESLKLEVAPYLGGRIASLYAKAFKSDILMPVETLNADRVAIDKPLISGGSYPLSPYSNRIKGATFPWQGQTHTLPESPIFSPNAIHGTACYTPWDVEEHKPHKLTIIQHHKANALWGFDFTLRQHFELCHNRFVNTLSFVNTHSTHQPVGLGFHPFFNAKNLQTLQIKARGMWLSEQQIPIERTTIPPQYDFNTPKPLLDTVDDLFYGVTNGCIAQYKTHKIVVSSNSQNAVLFSNNVRKFFCFEPVENVTNAHNMQDYNHAISAKTHPLNHGLTALAPSQIHEFTMMIEIIKGACIDNSK